MSSLLSFITLSTPLVERLGWVLIHSVWQFTLVGLLAAVVIRLMRGNSARARYGVLVVLLLVAVCFPVATWLQQPQFPVQVADTLNSVAVETTDSAMAPPAVQEPSGPDEADSVPSVIALQPESPDQALEMVAVLPMKTPQGFWLQRGADLLRPWLAWLVTVWAVGVAFFMLRPTWGWLTLRRLKRTGTTSVSTEIDALLTGVATRLGLRQSVSVLKSSLAQVPMVVGYIRPVVLLPASLLTSLPVLQLEAILAHELAHIRRNDFVVNLVQTLIETLFFYQPAIWWLSRRIRVEREHCCDDLVIDVMDNRTEYGRALVAIEELRGVNPVLSLSASDGSLLERIRRIANPKRQEASVSPWLGVFVLTCLVGLVLTLGSAGNSEVLAMSEGETQDTSQPIENDDSAKQMEPTPVWGKPEKGIRVAARYRLGDQRAEIAEDYANGVFPIESRVDIEYLIQNVSQKPIEFKMPTWLQEVPTFRVLVGKEERLAGAWYSGFSPPKSHTLMPKQIVAIPAIGVGFSKDPAQAVFDHPIGSVIECAPGKVHLRHKLTVGRLGDAFEATASTGVTSLTIRERIPKDNPSTFPVTLKFKNPDGSFADSGFVRVNHTRRRKILFEGELSGTSLTVPGCTDEALSVYRRLPGCVATIDRDVKPDPSTPVVLDQTASDPIRFRLVDPDGNAVNDAVVRLFTFGGTKASSNAYPTKGIKGEVYGRSDSAGNVTVDHVTSESDHVSLGNKTYFFYIQPKKLAPTFIGPVEAGATLGDITVGPFLEVSGEIHGTPKQLRNFSAEWDQPVEMGRGDGTVGLYAVSKRLQVKREGDKVVFKLTNLRPGTLRIVSRFVRGGGKNYSSDRLIAGPNDVVLEIDLTESRDDLVVKPRGAEPQDNASEGDNSTQ